MGARCVVSSQDKSEDAKGLELEGDPSLGRWAVDKARSTFAGRIIAPSGMDLGNGRGLTTSLGDGGKAIPSPAGAYPTITE